MKELVVIIGAIILGVIIASMIIGPGSETLQSVSGNIMENQIDYITD